MSLFLRVVFSRKTARTVRASEFVFLPSGFIFSIVTAPTGSLKLTSIPVAQLHRWQRMVLSEARGLRLFSVVQGGIGLHRRLDARRQKRSLTLLLDTLPRTRASQRTRLATRQKMILGMERTPLPKTLKLLVVLNV